jgi:hypothetical protein
MKFNARACGFAAAAVGCLAAAAFAEPSIASVAGESIIDAIQGEASAFSDTTVQLPEARRLTLDELVARHAEHQTRDVEQECLATAVYFEARGEPIDGQLAVADVVLNRTESGRYPDTICEVVKQPWQFSFVRNGRFPKADRTSLSWAKAVAISKIALGKVERKLPTDVLWYHADYVSPSWGKRLARQTKIGLHIFYS